MAVPTATEGDEIFAEVCTTHRIRRHRQSEPPAQRTEIDLEEIGGEGCTVMRSRSNPAGVVMSNPCNYFGPAGATQRAVISRTR
jgi:hypothetical protein